MDPLHQLALIWAGAFAAMFAANLTRMTPVLFYLGFGSLFVNTGLLPEESSEFIRIFSELGIILIMFALGFEEKTDKFLQSLKKSWGIAFFGALAPFCAAFAVTHYFWEDTSTALICGLTMTATAVSLTMVSLKSEGLQNSTVARRIMTSAVLDDIASLALVAILIPIVSGQSEFSMNEVFLTTGKAIFFFVVVSILGAFVFPGKKLNRLLSVHKGDQSTLILLLLALTVSMVGHWFGFHYAVGAYMAGLLLKEEYFHGLEGKNSYIQTKHLIDNIAFTWIGPVFFVSLGAKIILDIQSIQAVMTQTICLVLAVMVSQIISASLAARYLGGLKAAASVMVGIGMLGRAELAFVVMDIAYVQNSVIDRDVFNTLMFTAFWLNISVPLGIRLWKPSLLNETERFSSS